LERKQTIKEKDNRIFELKKKT
jgi:hypothetical protein